MQIKNLLNISTNFSQFWNIDLQYYIWLVLNQNQQNIEIFSTKILVIHKISKSHSQSKVEVKAEVKAHKPMS